MRWSKVQALDHSILEDRALRPFGLVCHDKRADCQATLRLIVRSERDGLDVADIDRPTGPGVGRLKVRVRAHLIERNPNLLPRASIQLRPCRVYDTIPIQERDREPDGMSRLDLK